MGDIIPIEPPGYELPPMDMPATAPRFTLEPWKEISFASKAEWRIKKLLPRHGVAVIYGRSQSFKSYVALDLCAHVAAGLEWAGRSVDPGPVVYIAAEGAGGLRKRKAGWQDAHPEIAADLPFYLVSAAPNLGTEAGDLASLVASIEAAGVAPAIIVLDTLAQSLGAGDENCGGMIAFVSNSTALANRFGALVIAVHHSGLGDDKRTRGHSSLLGAVDAQILCERGTGSMSTTLTLQKLKDEESNIALRADLRRVVVGADEDGEEISTLVVERIEDAAPKVENATSRVKTVPAAQRLLMAMVAEAIEEDGETFRPFGSSGALVRGVDDKKARERVYRRIAETAEPGEDADKLAERQRKAFNRSIADAIKAQRLMATERNGRRFVWLP